MSYRAGTRGLGPVGVPDGDPRLICDGCGTTRAVTRPDGAPFAWLLNWKSAPGWRLVRQDNGMTRRDYCPDCVARQNEAAGGGR